MIYPYVTCIMMYHDVIFANHLLVSDLQKKCHFECRRDGTQSSKEADSINCWGCIMKLRTPSKGSSAQKYPTGFEQKLGKLELRILFDHTKRRVFLISKSYATCTRCFVSLDSNIFHILVTWLGNRTGHWNLSLEKQEPLHLWRFPEDAHCKWHKCAEVSSLHCRCHSAKVLVEQFNISVQSHSLLSSELLSAIPFNLLVAKMSLEQDSSCFGVIASTKPNYNYVYSQYNIFSFAIAKTCQSVLHLWVQGRCSSIRSTRAGNSEVYLWQVSIFGSPSPTALNLLAALQEYHRCHWRSFAGKETWTPRNFSKEKREKREMTQANFSHLNWPRPLCGVATLLLLCVKGSKRPSKNGSIRDAGQHTTKII